MYILMYIIMYIFLKKCILLIMYIFLFCIDVWTMTKTKAHKKNGAGRAPFVVAGTYTHELPDLNAVEAFEKSLP